MVCPCVHKTYLDLVEGLVDEVLIVADHLEAHQLCYSQFRKGSEGQTALSTIPANRPLHTSNLHIPGSASSPAMSRFARVASRSTHSMAVEKTAVPR